MRLAQRMARRCPAGLALCGTVAALVSIGDLADRRPRACDGETLSLARIRCAGSTRRICPTAGNAVT